MVQIMTDNLTSSLDALPLNTTALLEGDIFGTGEIFGPVVTTGVMNGVVVHVVVFPGTEVGLSHVDVVSPVVQSSVSLSVSQSEMAVSVSQSEVVEIGPHG